MKVEDLWFRLDGKENVELHVDGLQLHMTARNLPEKYFEREVESIRLDPAIYLGIKIFIAQ